MSKVENGAYFTKRGFHEERNVGNEQMDVEEYRAGELHCLGSNQAVPCT